MKPRTAAPALDRAEPTLSEFDHQDMLFLFRRWPAGVIGKMEPVEDEDGPRCSGELMAARA